MVQLKKNLPPHFDNRTVIDLGCGTGYWTQAISQRATSIAGFDINEPMLQVAREKTYECPTSFAVRSYYDLKSLPHAYEGMFGGFIYSHVPKAFRVLFFRNLLSVLNPTGVGILLDNRFVEGSSTPIYKYDVSGNSYQIRKLENGEQFEILKNFPESDEWNYLSDLGISEWEYKEMTYYWILTFKIP
ncbi:MAG: class I SAM-dependent methyltransferase [Bacteroidota bacterium]